MRDDLGVEPSEQTRTLYEQLIQRGDPIESDSVRSSSFSAERRPSNEPPYKGLKYFEEDDAELFFGREQLTDRLITRLLNERFLAIIGASGSGKSSLVRAGIVPAIKCNNNSPSGYFSMDGRTSWCVQVITPTEQPLESLASTLVNISGYSDSTARFRENLEHDPLGYNRTLSQLLPEGERFVLVVDQFEELFTLCHDPFERESFVDHLLSFISEDRNMDMLVVLALRSDFYAHCAQFDNLRKALVEHQEYLGSMSSEELRRVIEEPAQAYTWELEPGLTDLILVELGDEPGKLPLLSHALLETWNRRNGQKLTLEGYIKSGGVREAISHTAENVYQKLSPGQRESAEDIFLDLTELGEDTADTRRRIARAELIDQDGVGIQEVLSILVEARLVTLGEDSVEVAHEALIRTWGRLRTWLEESREELHQQRKLTAVAQDWINAGRETSYLATGARLSQFEGLETNTDIELCQIEQEYLKASLAERNRQLEQEQKRLARQAKLEQRSRNRLRALVVVLLVATVGALTLSGLAWVQRQLAQKNEIAAQVLALTSGAQFAAGQGEPELALSLAMAANQLDQTNVQAQLTLSDLAYAPGIRRRLIEHSDQVSAVAVAPDGEQALSASWDKSLILWDVTSGQPVLRYNGHTGPVTAVAFNPDGKTALSGSADTTLILWDVESGSAIRQYRGHTGEVNSVAISPDGKLALSSSADQTLILWNLESGNIFRTLVGHTGEVNSASFNPDGRLIVSGASDNQVILWQVDTGKILHNLNGHLGAVTAVAFSPDGKSILSGSLDQVLILWDAASGETFRRYEGHQDQVNAVTFSPDGRTFISAGGFEEVFNTTRERILIHWDVASGQILQRFEGHAGPVSSVAFSPDGKTALSGSSDMSVIIWGLTSGAEIQHFEGHTSAINSLTFSADGKTALSGSADTSLIIWEISTGKPIIRFDTGTTIQAAAQSPDGQSALTNIPDDQLRLWDLTSGQAVRDFIGHTGQVTSVRFSPDGERALSGSLDRRIILWDLASGQPIREFTGHTNVVNSIAIRWDGKQALSGSYDHTMILWDIDSGQAIRFFPALDSVVNAVAFSPDGKTGLSGHADGNLILWDLETGIEKRRFSGHTGPVHAVTFSLDGKTALSGSMDRSLILWDVTSGQPIRRYLGHEDVILAAAFSPDGRTALSGSIDGSLRQWRIDSQDGLISWTEAFRFIIELPCEQRAFYRLEPLCESGEATPFSFQ